MATAAADEHMEALEQVGGDERAAEEGAGAAVTADDGAAEAMEQVEGEERAEVEAGAPAEDGAEASDEGHMEVMEQVEEEEEAQAEAEDEVQAEEVQAEAAEEAGVLSTVLPLGRVKKIMRVDRDIKKATAEASLLIAAATELFLGSLAAGAHTAAIQRGRRGLRGVDVRAAARAHRPTADFLLDCLPAAEVPRTARSGSDGAAAAATAAVPKPLPRGTRRIDGFFQKVT